MSKITLTGQSGSLGNLRSLFQSEKVTIYIERSSTWQPSVMIVEEACLSTVLRMVTHPADGSFGVGPHDPEREKQRDSE